MGGAVPFGCGQCHPCRINRLRQWKWRQWFESLTHEENCFVTLTYSDKYEPDGGNLEPRDLQLFIKRLRFAVSPCRIRYFSVGEYGEDTFRPHYHLSVFGLCGYSIVGSPPKLFSQLVDECWGRGFVKVDEFNEVTAQYVAGYVVKKLTDWRDRRLGNRVPEFARMSNRPGLGEAAMKIVAQQLSQNEHGMNFLETSGDVPRELKIGNRSVPLGRFLLKKLREAIGFTPEYINEVKQKKSMETGLELLAVFKNTLDADPLAPVTSRSVFLKEINQKVLQLEARALLYKKRSTI